MSGRASCRKHSNSPWQCDILDNNFDKKDFLPTFIDDYSRMMLTSRILASVMIEWSWISCSEL